MTCTEHCRTATRAYWTLTEGEQQARINHSLKYHRCMGSHSLPKGHISAQIGLKLQPNPHRPWPQRPSYQL